MKLLVTGGAGYIGSHTALHLLNSGHDVTIFDNLSNSSAIAVERIASLSSKRPELIVGDILDSTTLHEAFSKTKFDAAIHFAGVKAVGESVADPLLYYQTNVTGTLNLLSAMKTHSVKRIIFSSSATVYGSPKTLPITENADTQPTNPYGRSKLIVEQILQDLFISDPEWRIASLRYFNPVGADASGLIGEHPSGVPNNLMPFVSQVACGIRERLSVFGQDYPTLDGTGVRDYIHVSDLADGHLAALNYISSIDQGCFLPANLGAGKGYSVLELISAFEQASCREIPYTIVDRRPGDIATSYADPALANKLFGWFANRGIQEMCADTWRWQSNNQNGYGL